MEYCKNSKNDNDSCNYSSNLKNLFDFFNHESIWQNQGYRKINGVPKTLEDCIFASYRSCWKNALMGSDKLVTYRKFKNELKMENYLSFGTSESRQKFTKLRISAHRLQIELGRHRKPESIPRELRVCIRCNSGAIDDEFHAVMKCNKFKAERNNLFLALKDLSMFDNLRSDYDKFLFLMKRASIDLDYHKLLTPLIKKIFDSC